LVSKLLLFYAGLFGFNRRFGRFFPFGPEFLHAAGGVNEFFLPGVKRMAVGANFHLYLFFGRADFIRLTAGAFYDGSG